MSVSEDKLPDGKSANRPGLLSRLIDTGRPFDIEGVPPSLYAVIAVLSIAVLELGLLPQTGIVGAFAVLWTIGLVFFAIGERVRPLKALLGGGLVIAWAGAAVIANLGLISADEIAVLQGHIIDNRLLYFLLASLVISSVLGVPTSVLRKSLVSYAPIIIGGLVLSAVFGMVAGLLAGIPADRVITMYFLPIMGGGGGAGALPMSEIYGTVTGNDVTGYFNYAIGVLTLGNITAILIASGLVHLRRRAPSLSGDGRLVRGATESIAADDTTPEDEINTHSAMVFVVCILLAGIVLATVIGSLHFFAWVTIIAILVNFSRAVSPAMRTSLRRLSAWGMRAFLVTILVAFGLSADLHVIAGLFTAGNLLVIVAIVCGAALGAGLVAQAVRCFPIEGAVSGGLCMANAGGSGDLQVLSAARLLALFPYAQISSRIGGAFVLVLANYLFAWFT